MRCAHVPMTVRRILVPTSPSHLTSGGTADDMPPLVDRPPEATFGGSFTQATYGSDPTRFLDMPRTCAAPADDDDMPPLVDRPPPLMMTYTFGNDLTPITYSTDPTRFEVISEEDAPHICAPAPGEDATATRASHAKKRDASYIPRPPNAFILFRSSFIKSQQIPGKIEGNHSTLSKIIGIVWKTLPREEREHWEAEAVKAQAEHRARYPHWRFRPAANALAKVKDKIKDGPPARRRKNRKGEDDEGGGGGVRKKIKVEKVGDKERCAKIAGLLAEGMKGAELETAMKAWETEGKSESVAPAPPVRGRAKRSVHAPKVDALKIDSQPMATADAAHGLKARSASPASPTDDARFTVPLTAMFRRSSSVPACPLVPQHRRDSVDSSPAILESLSPMLAFAAPYASPLSPPGSPYSVGTADSDASSIATLDTPTLDKNVFISNYSSLCDWAGDVSPASPTYSCVPDVFGFHAASADKQALSYFDAFEFPQGLNAGPDVAQYPYSREWGYDGGIKAPFA
ncbi:hypothetical protein BV25DRAFT_354197 [Artomyces pyxidatus]|uniref:Uncharacterized protein n=1 Tax=Artomyces pyxidatus TaxID=48021 RepID=A0ACB8T716_9AGAM|nr:hypothetical protein BV25DRAFT_354197 [Artomyces pyxidatus]